MRFKLLTVIVIGLLLGLSLISANVLAVATKDAPVISTSLSGLQALPTVISAIKAPELKNPDWLQAQLDAEKLARQQTYSSRPSTGGVVYYSVATNGIITADLNEFKTQASQTLNDSSGWSRLGVRFQEVASGGSFTIILSEAGLVHTYHPVCSDYWSCSVGRNIVINQDRWLYASPAWNEAKGALSDYRHMVITHETGHWLGHPDDNGHCGGSGQLAPVMQQQSINLLGCNFNPWPLDSELWSSTLGI